jgi:hypothetical protein
MGAFEALTGQVTGLKGGICSIEISGPPRAVS